MEDHDDRVWCRHLSSSRESYDFNGTEGGEKQNHIFGIQFDIKTFETTRETS